MWERSSVCYFGNWDTFHFERLKDSFIHLVYSKEAFWKCCLEPSAIWFVWGDGNSVWEYRNLLAKKLRKLEHSLNGTFSRSLPDNMSHSDESAPCLRSQLRKDHRLLNIRLYEINTIFKRISKTLKELKRRVLLLMGGIRESFMDRWQLSKMWKWEERGIMNKGREERSMKCWGE